MSCVCKEPMRALADRFADLPQQVEAAMASLIAALVPPVRPAAGGQKPQTPAATPQPGRASPPVAGPARVATTAPAGVTPGATESAPTPAQQMEALSRYLMTRLPAAPWSPDPAWAKLRLPAPPLEQNGMIAVMTLAMAQGEVNTKLGLDVLQPAAVTPLRRLIATLNTRVETLPKLPNPAGLLSLANRASAVRQVETAAARGAFTITPEKRASFETPAGIPLKEWQPLYQQVQALAPLIAAALHFNIDPTSPQLAQQFAEKLRPLRGLSLPKLAAMPVVASYISVANGLSQLATALKVDPLAYPAAELEAMIADEETRVLDSLPSSEPPSLPAIGPVSSMLNESTVTTVMAMRPEALQAMTWKVPDASSFPLVSSALPAAAFVAALRGLQIDPIRARPCEHQCDAATLLRQADAADAAPSQQAAAVGAA